MFVEGIVKSVHHCDIRSLYPSLMLQHGLAPRTDELGVFLQLLDVLKTFRVEAKRKMQESAAREEGLAKPLSAENKGFSMLRKMGYKEGDFPITEKICGEILSLPMSP